MAPIQSSFQTTIKMMIKLEHIPLIGKKSFWGKEKLLILSNFSFSNNDFSSDLQQPVKALYCLVKG